MRVRMYAWRTELCLRLESVNWPWIKASKWKRLQQKAGDLAQSGQLDRALEAAQRSLEAVERLGGHEHPGVVDSLLLLAVLHVQQSQITLAEPLCQRALTIAEQNPPAPRTLMGIGVLAKLYREQGQYAQAEALHLRRRDLVERLYSGEKGYFCFVLSDLVRFYQDYASVCTERGRLEEAEDYYRRAVAAEEEAHGCDDLSTAMAMRALATFYDGQGRTEESDRLYSEILNIEEKARYTEDIGASRCRAFQFISEREYPERAEMLLGRQLALREEALGPDHPDLAPVLNALGELCKERKGYVEAEAYCLRALAILEKTYGPSHPDVADSLNCLVWVFQAQRQFKKAEPLLHRVLEIRENAMAADCDKKTTVLRRLMRRHETQNPHGDMERYFTRERVASALRSLANHHERQEHHEEAELFYKRALAVQEQGSDRDRRDMAETLNELANLHIARKQYAQANVLLDRAGSGQEDCLEVFTAQLNRANLYENQGQFELTEQVYKRLLQTMERPRTPNDLMVLFFKDMARFYRAAGREDDAVTYEQRAAKLEPAKG